MSYIPINKLRCNHSITALFHSFQENMAARNMLRFLLHNYFHRKRMAIIRSLYILITTEHSNRGIVIFMFELQCEAQSMR